MSTKHFHVWFIPGEAYSSTATRHYLGYMLSTDGVISTDTTIEVAGTGLANTADDWRDFVGGKGHAIKKTLRLALMSYMVDTGSGYFVNIGETGTIGGELCTKAWMETLTDLAALGSSLHGKVCTFSNGDASLVAPVNAEIEPGTNMYKLWVKGRTAISGPCRVGISRTLPMEELWFEQRFASMLSSYGGVGLLLIKFGDRDIITDDVADSYGTQLYRCRLMQVTLKTKYGDAPYLTYEIPVEAAIYDATTEEESTMSNEFNLVASDKTYSDAILLTWDAVDNATRYQIYVGESPVFDPDCLVEEQTLSIYLYASKVLPINSLADGGTGFINVNTGYAHGYVKDQRVYCMFNSEYICGWFTVEDVIDSFTFSIAGTFSTNTAGSVFCEGLLAEVPANDWLATAIYFKSLGFIHGATKNVPGDGTIGNPYYPFTPYSMLTETQMWYWIRARVASSGSSEWTTLDEDTESVQGTVGWGNA